MKMWRRFINSVFRRFRQPKDPEYVGWISRRSYEEHAHSPEVQAIIEKARRTWHERYGVDPAAKRLERLNEK